MGLVLNQHLHALHICAPELQAVFHALYLGNKFTIALGTQGQKTDTDNKSYGKDKRTETILYQNRDVNIQLDSQ